MITAAQNFSYNHPNHPK